MESTLRFTDVSSGILRMRNSTEHAQTISERYGIVTLPSVLSPSGIAVDKDGFILPNGRRLDFRLIGDAEYETLHASLADEFKDKFTNYQEIIGTPEESNQSGKHTLPTEMLPAEASFAISIQIADGERFYGLGEGANDRIELRGRAYQNWVRYQYNEIPIPLVLSSEGWGIFLNTRARSFVDIDCRKSNQLICLGEDDELDLFLLYGENLGSILKKYTMLTGAPMLLPKWAYGLTYIAPIFATQHDVLAHAERFRREHIPCDMFSLEPGWMEKFYDYSTLKKWDLKRFHVTEHYVGKCSEITFIAALHRYHFQLSLWLCIRHDLTAEAEREIVNGSPDDFGEAWYDHLCKFVDNEVDGFKLDPADMVCCFDRMDRPRCANGLTTMQMHNYNQILLTKQMYEGYKKQTGKRPMHHYCGGYSGIQKWSAATTGDNGGELGAMIWLETLAMSGHMNTTIDMNIHHPESIHFGMFVPWAHLNAWHGAEQPWYAGDRMHVMFVEYARLRYRLLPYFYSTAIEGHETSKPIVRPMPFEFPDDEATVRETRQYMVGANLMISAYTTKVHLPAGHWTDAWTGVEYAGPCDIEPYTPPENRGGGLFIRGGAVIPGWCDRDYISQYSDEQITLDIYPDGHSSYIFREDDGVSLDYETKSSCKTLITVDETDGEIIVNISKREGEYAGKPKNRTWIVHVHPRHGTDCRLSVNCAEDDKVLFSISKCPIELFKVNADEVLIYG